MSQNSGPFRPIKKENDRSEKRNGRPTHGQRTTPTEDSQTTIARLRTDRNQRREKVRELEKKVKVMDEIIGEKDQLIEELKTDYKKLAAKVRSQDLIETELEKTKNDFEELKAKKISKDRQLTLCMKDLEKERKAREEQQHFLALEEDEKLKAKNVAEERRVEITKKNEQLDQLKKQLCAARMANKVTPPTNNPELVRKLTIAEKKNDKLQKQIDKLKETNESQILLKKIEDMQKSFHTQITALKNQRKYFEASAENNKRKRALAEYVIDKKNELERKKLRKIAENEQNQTELIFDSMARSLLVVIKQHQRSLNANNCENLVKIAAESARQENIIIESSQKIVKKSNDGKFECPECSFVVSGVPTFASHMKAKHGVTIGQPNKKVIDIDLTED